MRFLKKACSVSAISLLFGAITSLSYASELNEKPFEKSDWKEYKGRPLMAQNLISSKRLISAKRADVNALLGIPFREGSLSDEYALELAVSDTNVPFAKVSSLKINYQKDVVVEALMSNILISNKVAYPDWGPPPNE